MRWSLRSRAFWIMPLVLLVVILLEELVTFEVRRRVPQVHRNPSTIGV